ncbi:DUF488 domain-containing protein [Sphingobacterium wenxiniae]|uniref:Uncharacterized conserved protein YeaO, DUF488 family n=1 Tax=Sphingobacterium wenxiniae TaxID=683125 RepID=A0A1I6TWT0_9SPHI|nr:DUF488 family protein [Sphingobacterium wenxiniae]SFS93615.1 Uncharacterized conserved protein YeaO, DUF488 family [Sphingobacterium wenxiniae]
MNPKIFIKRIYEDFDEKDGYRVLVDRLWPRGVKKEDAHLNEWAKDLAPSTEARIEFGHIPEHWNTFKQRYNKELDANDQIAHYLEKWEEQSSITLLYAAKDTIRTHALVLQEYLEKAYGARKE